MIAVLIGVIFAHSGFAFGPFNSRPYITPTQSPTSSVCVSWNTAALESTIVAYGTTALEDTFRLDTVQYHHHALLTGLQPKTRYCYKVHGFGETRQFFTFPECSDTFSFVAFGDTRSDSAAHQSVIDRIASYSFDFIVHSGDFVNNGDKTVDEGAYYVILVVDGSVARKKVVRIVK